MAEGAPISPKEIMYFMLPLVVNSLIRDIGEQCINAGIGHAPKAVETLAAYGMAIGILEVAFYCLFPARQVALVLTTSENSKRRLWLLFFSISTVLVSVMAIVGGTYLGHVVINEWHDAPSGIADQARWALLLASPYVYIECFQKFYSGLLLKARRTTFVTVSTVADMATKLLLLVVCILFSDLFESFPIAAPLLVMYGGGIAALLVLVVASRGVEKLDDTHPDDCSLLYAIRFYWPLAIVQGIQGARPDGAYQVGVLRAVYPLAHLPYAWVNEAKALAPAFKSAPGFKYSRVRNAIAGMVIIAFSANLLMFWTPVTRLVTVVIMGFDEDFANAMVWPLRVMSFIVFFVGMRSHWHGIAFLRHWTTILLPSGPVRLSFIAIALALVPLILPSVSGAVVGTLALLVGFGSEAGTVWLGLFIKQRMNPTKRTLARESYTGLDDDGEAGVMMEEKGLHKESDLATPSKSSSSGYTIEDELIASDDPSLVDEIIIQHAKN